MRVAIASRIFEPEPSAASFRLGALATACFDAGHQVEVLTVKPPRSLAGIETTKPYRVSRFPVLRDASGYVRGYLQYLSFDVPLFFRLLFGRRQDLIVVEPPPTTGFFVRLAAAARRTPYVYYAADIWSEAARQTTAAHWVVGAVARIERWAIGGAALVLSVSPAVTERLESLGVRSKIVTVGNGVDVTSFTRGLADWRDVELPSTADSVFVYAGTASEWHGAEVFVLAMPELLASVPGARLRFIGGGSERERLRELSEELGVASAVAFEPLLSASDLADVLQHATAAVASVRPNSSYAFAFPTKLYSAAACGTPIIFAGEGPTRQFVAEEVNGKPLGVSVEMDAPGVAKAMIKYAAHRSTAEERQAVAAWARKNVDLGAVAERAVEELRCAVKVSRRR